MSSPLLSPKDLLDLIKLVESIDSIQDFHLRHGDLEVSLSKRGAGQPAGAPAIGARQTPAPAPAPAGAPSAVAAVPATSAPPASPAALLQLPPGAQVIKSPSVGTFYAAKEPGAAPFVTVGQEIASGTTLCIIEVMKLMNTVQAGINGVVTQILVSDGQAVEYGQPLMVITAAAA